MVYILDRKVGDYKTNMGNILIRFGSRAVELVMLILG